MPKKTPEQIRRSGFNHHIARAFAEMAELRYDNALGEINASKRYVDSEKVKTILEQAITYIKEGEYKQVGNLLSVAVDKVNASPVTPFKFKPSRVIENSPFTNGERANRASSVIAIYDSTPLIKNTKADVDYDMATDLLSDIAHLCDSEGWDFDAMLNTVRMHWQSER